MDPNSKWIEGKYGCEKVVTRPYGYKYEYNDEAKEKSGQGADN
jgi:hypothetical protein